MDDVICDYYSFQFNALKTTTVFVAKLMLGLTPKLEKSVDIFGWGGGGKGTFLPLL